MFIRVIIFITLITTLLQAAGDIAFQRYSIEEGLSESTTFSIIQDSVGFLWFGTNDGLNRYDGYKFIHYKPDDSDSTSISGNRIFELYIDKQNTLWAGTEYGLNRYNAETNNFTHYINEAGNNSSLSNNTISEILEDSRGNFWVGTNDGLNLFNRITGRVVRFMADFNDSSAIIERHIWEIFEDSQNRLWIGTDRGINQFDYKTGKFKRYFIKTDGKIDFLVNTIFDINEDHSGNLWVSTRAGVHRFIPETGDFISFHHNPEDPSSLSYENVWQTYEDSRGNFWVTTLGGGLNLKSKDNKFRSFRNSPKNPQSISSDYIWEIYEDRHGIIWLGTELGINKYDPQLEKFNLISHQPYDDNSLVNNEVYSVLKDSRGDLWIGTRSGLNKYSPKEDKYELYLHHRFNQWSISNNYIKAIFEDSEGRIWVGTNGGGLNLFRDGNFVLTFNNSNRSSLTSNKIISIDEDNEGNLWLGTMRGINMVNPETGHSVGYFNEPTDTTSIIHDYVTVVKYDSSEECLWIGTQNGLDKFIPDEKRFVHYQRHNFKGEVNIPVNFIWDIHLSGDTLWIGTNRGLLLFDKKQDRFKRIPRRNPLSRSVVYGILEDKYNNLWLSTNKGIYVYNYKSQKLKNYTAGDGLQSNQFTGGAVFADDKGKFYFGGIKGLNSFYPDSIKDVRTIPPVVITEIKTFNHSLRIREDGPLRKSIFLADTVEFSYRVDDFNLEFAVLDYAVPDENRFMYKLDNFDDNWQRTGNRNYAIYTNVPPGEYVFRVIGANNNDVWNRTGATLRIIIHPPFWQKWWFILIVSLTLLTIIYLLIRNRIQTLLEMERLRTRIAADLHDDVGTQLTEISMLSDIVAYQNKENSEDPVINKIGDIARSLIDKMDSIVWLVNPQKDTLYELFLKLKDNYEEILNSRNIIINIKNFDILESIHLPMEKRKNIYLIYKEAINNSLKHSDCTEIKVETFQKGKRLSIILSDNGKGFNPDYKYPGNGLSNMKQRAEMSEGKVEIKSGTEGTKVIFTGKI